MVTSLVKIGRSGRLMLGPNRVQPLAMADGIPAPDGWLGAENRSRCIIGLMDLTGSCAREDPVIRYLKQNGPASPAELLLKTGISELSLERRLENLVFHRQVLETGFTPTDALHVLGKVEIGNSEKAMAGAWILARLRTQSVEAFCRDVVLLTQKKIETAILAHVFQKQTGKAMDNFLSENRDDPLMSVSFKLNIPIVGIGAASRQLLPEVAERLQTNLIFPPHYQVGNALGAIMIAMN